MLEDIKSRIKGKVVVLGIGNSMRSDDAAGTILAQRIMGLNGLTVFDAKTTPENYLEKIIKEKPDTVLIVDAADFGGKPGEIRALDAKDVKTVNLFSTHNASIYLTINYLQMNLAADIIILIIQPKSLSFGEVMSLEMKDAVSRLRGWFNGS